MKVNCYIVTNIVVISFLTVHCDDSESSSSESDIDPEHEVVIPLSDEEKPTKRTRTTTVLTTKDPRFEVVPKVMVFDLG